MSTVQEVWREICRARQAKGHTLVERPNGKVEFSDSLPVTALYMDATRIRNCLAERNANLGIVNVDYSNGNRLTTIFDIPVFEVNEQSHLRAVTI